MKSLALGVVLVAACAQSATYEVSFDLQNAEADVILTVDRGTATEFHMPAWSPGDYRIVDFGRHVRGVRFSRLGVTVAHEKVGTNHWRSTEEADTVTYSVATQPAGIFSENLRITANEAFVHGPAVFGWLTGHAEQAHTLRVTPYPSDEASIAIALAGPDKYTFRAENYDVLIDSPFAMGNSVRLADFVVAGKRHAVALYGPRSPGVPLDGFLDVCQRVASQGFELFGELPYDRFVFLFDVGGPGGGLEHRDSARMAVWGSAAGSRSLIAHEYMHAFNVKRIRPKPLGPFDYTKPAVTGSLWWLEGVTDYYADVLLVRSGMVDRAAAMRGLSSELRSFGRVANRLRVSADESSRRVWETRNSSGYGIDYYTKGKLIGLVLDLAIRGETEGMKSLDDVLLALYHETKGGKPGYSEDRIRKLCIQVGGAALGPIYDTCVLEAKELPLDVVLPRVGWSLEDGQLRDNPSSPRTAGRGWPNKTN